MTWVTRSEVMPGFSLAHGEVLWPSVFLVGNLGFAQPVDDCPTTSAADDPGYSLPDLPTGFLSKMKGGFGAANGLNRPNHPSHLHPTEDSWE